MRNRRLWLIVAAGILCVAVALAVTWKVADNSAAAPTEIDYSVLTSEIDRGQIAKISLSPKSYTAQATRTKGNEVVAVNLPGQYGTEEVTTLAQKHDVPITVDLTEPETGGRTIGQILISLLPTLLLFALIVWVILRMAPPRQMTTPLAKSSGGVTFADVAGCDEAIEELQDVRSFLADPARFSALGAKIPKGILLHGPPGTGKTLLARALATEAGVSFFSVSGSDFVEMYAGLGSSRIRKLFRQVKKQGPAIVFIDELDALGRKRSDGGDGGTREGDNTLNSLLVEMDGFDESTTPLIIIGATNRLDVLDAALLRPGRFDRVIPLDAPDRAGRLRVLETHARGKPLDPAVRLTDVAQQTAGMSGADLANLLNEGALLAARHGRRNIGVAEIDQAMLRVMAGPARENRRMSDRERRIIAAHETGHALVGELLDENEQVTKISIIPRGRSGGQTLSASAEDVFLHSEALIRNRLAMLLAGRAAELVVFGEATTGAASDLERASELAYRMLDQYGFSEQLGLMTSSRDRPLSHERAAELEREAKRVLDEEHQRATSLITDRRADLDRIVAALLERETLAREDFLALIEEPVHRGP